MRPLANLLESRLGSFQRPVQLRIMSETQAGARFDESNAELPEVPAEVVAPGPIGPAEHAPSSVGGKAPGFVLQSGVDQSRSPITSLVWSAPRHGAWFRKAAAWALPILFRSRGTSAAIPRHS